MQIRNPQGIWVNVSPFREAALQFQEHGYYCGDPAESLNWFEFWKRERERCISGLSVGGVRITGDHYFYLNYAPMDRADLTNVGSRRVTTKRLDFPDFWDGDYNYFWCREIARHGVYCLMTAEEQKAFDELKDDAKLQRARKLFNSLQLDVKVPDRALLGGFNLIVGKARRKGYSYKNAAIAANNFFTRPRSLTIMNAYESQHLYPNGLFSKAVGVINFVNDHTAWTMPSDVINKSDHIRASYITYKDGVRMEKGFKSEVWALTCNTNPGVNRGKDAYDIFVEEAGSFGVPGHLKELYAASKDCVSAGMMKTGMITIFGTSGEMESGSLDYANMHTKPEAFEMLPFENIWEEGRGTSLCGFFHPASWNLEGFYDGQGNSDVEAARKAELDARERLTAGGASSMDMQRRMQERPLTPSEAFSISEASVFPVAELANQLSIVRSKGWQQTKGTPVEFYREEGMVKAKPILSGGVKPITSLNDLPANKEGCPIIYEYPEVGTPRGLYKIGYDPVRQDNGTSLAAIIVYKSFSSTSERHSCIAAEYVGRRAMSDDMDAMAEYLADFYNTTIMYENEVIGTKNYFRRIKRLNLLANQPDGVINKNIKGSRVSRVYGCHMVPQLKDAGERYVKDWLLTPLNFDEHGNPVRALDSIYSERLLEELIAYRRGGNFDLISALFMCLFQVQEELEGKDYAVNAGKRRMDKIIALHGKRFRNNGGLLNGY